MLSFVVHRLGDLRKSAREDASSRLFCFTAGFSGSPNGVLTQVGRYVSTSVNQPAFKLPDGYFPDIVGAFLTWQGKSLEGQGVKPDIEVPLSYQAISNGRDNQLEAAIEIVTSVFS